MVVEPKAGGTPESKEGRREGGRKGETIQPLGLHIPSWTGH